MDFEMAITANYFTLFNFSKDILQSITQPYRFAYAKPFRGWFTMMEL
jgi:hypothetical protein